MSAEQITNETYDRIAADFADRYWNVVLEKALHDFTAAITGKQPVLDAGCGPGRDTVLLRERGLNVAGMDLSAGMLREAKRRVSGGMLLQGNMRAMPLRNASFSGVWMCASLLHIPREFVPDVLAETRRILEAGGVLYVSVQEGEGERWADSDGGRRFFTLFQSDDLIMLLTQAGFTVREHWTAPGGHSMWISILAVNPG